jgi:hypothetical protein
MAKKDGPTGTRKVEPISDADIKKPYGEADRKSARKRASANNKRPDMGRQQGEG